MNNKPKMICLMGPTASGKTDLAIELVQRGLPIEIISVDSALIYRDMDIGTAKPTKEELTKAPHRLIDILDPIERYSVGQFCEDIEREVRDITARGRTPLLVGGTMMYFQTLKNGLAELPGSDLAVREAVLQEAKSVGWREMHLQLQAVDPVYAAKIDPNDPQRIQRALEVYRLTGVPFSRFHHQQQNPENPLYQINPFILALSDRPILHSRIEQRFDKMLAQGLIDEVRGLHQRENLHLDLPSMRTVGYRQVWKYLDGEWDAEMMRQKAIVATRQLAKRQYTWLRQWENTTWYDSEKKSAVEQLILDITKSLNQ